MNADVAQWAEQPLRKRQGASSNLAVGLLAALDRFLEAARRTRRERETAGPERGLRAAMERWFREQRRVFGERAGQAVTPGETPSSSAFDGALEAALLAGKPAAAAAAQSAVESALLLGAQAALADLGDIGLGIAFDLRNPRAVAYLQDKGAALVTQINETTQQEMRDLIVRMVEERASYDQVAREISRRWAEMAIPKPQGHIDSRAHLIAVTEVGQAYEQGNLAAVQDMASLGLAMEKSWLTVGDNRVSDDCAKNEGAGWIPLDEPFPSGDDRPLRFPGCRCTALYRRVGSG